MRLPRALPAALAVALVLGTAPAVSATPAGSPAAAPSRPVPPSFSPVVTPTVQPQATAMHGSGPDDPARGAVAGSFRISASRWDQVEMEDGKFYWPLVDQAIDEARARGAQDVLLVLGSTPPWAARGADARFPTAPEVTRPPQRIADWERWVRRIATRYSGQGFAYQVWNEANLSTFWTGTPEEMADLTDRAYRIINDVDPSGTVVAASTTLRLTKDFLAFYPRYLAALRQRGWPVDVFSAHTYPASTGSPLTRQGLIRQYLAVLARGGAPSRPVWDTEVNYGLAGPGPSYPEQDIDGRRAAAWVAQTYLDSLRLGISRTYWYEQTRPGDFLGIQMWADTPGVTAERWVYRYLTGRTWNGCRTKGRVVRCRLTGPEGSASILWATGRGRARVPAGATTRCTALDRCRTVRPGQRVRVTDLPIRLGPPA